MSCSETDLAELWLDGELAPVEAAAFEAHLESCEACRRELTALRRLLAAARQLPTEVAPARDLWPAIDRALARSGQRRRGWRRPMFLAIAAAVVAAVSVIFLLEGLFEGAQQSKAPWASHEASTQAPPRVGTGEVGTLASFTLGAPIDTLEAAFDSTRQQLLSELAHQGGEKPTEAQEVVLRNLETIEAAIEEIRLALAEEPSNHRLQHQLLASYQKQVELLTLASRLSQT